MKRIFIILNFLLLSSVSVKSNTNKIELLKKIKISGFISDSTISAFDGKLEIYYHKRFNERLWYSGKTIPLKITKNKFSIEIQPETEISYIQIRKGIKGSAILLSLQMDALLINPGDSIFMDLTNANSIFFSGYGSEKLNYQQYAGNLALSWGTLKQIKKASLETIAYWRKLASEHLCETKTALNKIKNKISINTYNVLFSNTTASICQQHLDHLMSGMFRISRDSLYLKTIDEDLRTMDITQRSFINLDPLVIEYSSNYISYLSNFQIKFAQFFFGTEVPPFEIIYKKIIEDYDGKIRDEILAYTINRCYASFGASEFIWEALKIVKDENSKAILQKIYDAKAPGADAFNFSFEGLTGKRLSLSELKGKVIVIDAYFNGCIGCIGLANRMRPIIEHYKNNKNIVFISLSVDKDKKTFVEGAKSGKYGSINSIYLYTNGEGFLHPICSYYGWSIFPNTLYIDKAGKIIQAQKIDPINKEKEIISLINHHL